MKSALAACLLALSVSASLAQPVSARDVTRALTAHRAQISYYGSESGTHTANGERYRPHGLTCAHRSYPFGTRLRVTYGERSAICRVNDRGPAKWTGRTLDVSLGMARVLGLIRRGHGPATIERLL